MKNILHWRLCNRCHIYMLVCVIKTAFLMILCMALVVHLRFYLLAKTQLNYCQKQSPCKVNVYEFFFKNSWKHNKLPMHESKHLITDEDPYNVTKVLLITPWTATNSRNCKSLQNVILYTHAKTSEHLGKRFAEYLICAEHPTCSKTDRIFPTTSLLTS